MTSRPMISRDGSRRRLDDPTPSRSHPARPLQLARQLGHVRSVLAHVKLERRALDRIVVAARPVAQAPEQVELARDLRARPDVHASAYVRRSGGSAAHRNLRRGRRMRAGRLARERRQGGHGDPGTMFVPRSVPHWRQTRRVSSRIRTARGATETAGRGRPPPPCSRRHDFEHPAPARQHVERRHGLGRKPGAGRRPRRQREQADPLGSAARKPVSCMPRSPVPARRPCTGCHTWSTTGIAWKPASSAASTIRTSAAESRATPRATTWRGGGGPASTFSSTTRTGGR